jgi:hypothetical protein
VRRLSVWIESTHHRHGSDTAEDHSGDRISEPKNCRIQGSFFVLINQNEEKMLNLAA